MCTTVCMRLPYTLLPEKIRLAHVYLLVNTYTKDVTRAAKGISHNLNFKKCRLWHAHAQLSLPKGSVSFSTFSC